MELFFTLLALFILEVILLSFLSQKLHLSLSRLLYKLTNSQARVVNILAIIFLPGTIIHEISHLLTAGVLLVPVGELEVMPKVSGDEVKLGSVQIGQTDPIRRTVIGFAPVILGVFLTATTLYFWPINLSTPPWQVIVSVLIIFELSNTMFSSKKDLEGAAVFIISMVILSVIVLTGLYLAGYLNNLPLGKLDLVKPGQFLQTLNLTLLVPIVIDLVAVGLLNLTKLKGN